ncbi:MAG: MerR family DNA-binding protein, partial [Bdellovibrionales bacterium]|nr:MerR family DNA-binding protein [Bdellovibrionales bacterium]
MGLWRNKTRASKEVKSLANKHIAELEFKIKEMQEMVDNLVKLSRNCHGDDRPECPIISSLEGKK